ncbi:16S rRNA (guanine(527)-N(7))-methyltransferase RsmG [Pasteurella multocida]|uniref:16S rRNA (guanine(527)-N(7))-methyltransferase RsmG n=1 Tax=Pasteurella multocida TaxID=747 RepID=UPI003D32F49C
MTNLEQQLSQKLEILLKQTALSITDQQKEQLIKLVLLLNKWNKAYNLTSVRDPMEMLVKHILDSVVVSPHLQGKHFIDVGTGPGLPGLPLAIVNPNKHFVLLDSLGKRISFIRNAIRELGLDNVEAVLSRVEEYHPEQPFDGCIKSCFCFFKRYDGLVSTFTKTRWLFLCLKRALPSRRSGRIK